MTQFEYSAGQSATSRRAIDSPRIPRTGIQESIHITGLAIPSPVSSGAMLANELNKTLSGTANLVGAIGDQANHERSIVIKQMQAQERERNESIKEANAVQREQRAIDRQISLEERASAAEQAELYITQFRDDLDNNRIDLAGSTDEIVNNRILEATAGSSEDYFNVFARQYTAKAHRAINDQRNKIRQRAYEETIGRSPNLILTAADRDTVTQIVNDLHALDKSVPITMVAARVILPAANRAAEAGDTQRVKMLTSLLSDVNFAIDKNIINNKLQAASIAVKARKESEATNALSSMLADRDIPISAVRSVYELRKDNLSGEEQLRARNRIDDEESRRLRESQETAKAARVQAYKQNAYDQSLALFTTGQGWAIDAVEGKDGMPSIPKEELQAYAARKTYERYKAIDETTADTYYIRDIAQNGYADPAIKSYLTTGTGFVSQAMTADSKASVDAFSEIEKRYAQYNFIRSINPTYANTLAGNENTSLYSAIEDVYNLDPTRGVKGAIETVSRNFSENSEVNFTNDEKRLIQNDVESFAAPWFSSNANNINELTAQAQSMVRGYVLLGSPFEQAKRKAKERLEQSFTIVNNWAINTEDVRLQNINKNVLTEVMLEKYAAYQSKHKDALAALGVEDQDNWTFDFNPKNGYFSIRGKDPSIMLPVTDSELSVFTIDDVIKDMARVQSQMIRNQWKTKRNSPAVLPAYPARTFGT